MLPARGEQRGAASIVTVMWVVVVCVIAMTIAAVMTVFSAQTTARTAADLAALAGASGVWTQQGCVDASRIAEHNGARLVSCEVEGLDVQVDVTVDVFVLPGARVRASARAGPPEA